MSEMKISVYKFSLFLWLFLFLFFHENFDFNFCIENENANKKINEVGFGDPLGLCLLDFLSLWFFLFLLKILIKNWIRTFSKYHLRFRRKSVFTLFWHFVHLFRVIYCVNNCNLLFLVKLINPILLHFACNNATLDHE